jgi:hypothetical protein
MWTGEPLKYIAWCPDGSCFIGVAFRDESNMVLFSSSGGVLGKYPIPENLVVRYLGFSHDGLFVALAGEVNSSTRILIFDLSKGLVTLDSLESGSYIYVRWGSRHNHLLIVEENESVYVKVIDCSGNVITAFKIDEDIYRAVWDPSDRYIALIGNDLLVYDLNGSLIWSSSKYTVTEVNLLVWGYDGKALLAVYNDGKTIDSLSMNGDLIWTLNLNSSIVALASSPTQPHLALGTGDGQLIVVDKYGKIQFSKPLHDGSSVTALSWHYNGDYLAIGLNGEFQGVVVVNELGNNVWNKSTSSEVREVLWSPASDILLVTTEDNTLIYGSGLRVMIYSTTLVSSTTATPTITAATTGSETLSSTVSAVIVYESSIQSNSTTFPSVEPRGEASEEVFSSNYTALSDETSQIFEPCIVFPLVLLFIAIAASIYIRRLRR